MSISEPDIDRVMAEQKLAVRSMPHSTDMADLTHADIPDGPLTPRGIRNRVS
jgi:hypothetical protein